MGIFGFFSKKGKNGARKEEGGQPTTLAGQRGARPAPAPGNTLPPPEAAGRDRSAHVARGLTTAKKIDAIESAMSSELVPETPPVDVVAASPASIRQAVPSEPAVAAKKQVQVPVSFETTLPSLGMSTEFLLGVEGKAIPVQIEVTGSDNAPVIEEAAILFANGQADLVEVMLRSGLADSSAEAGDRDAWWMLFDLYQISGRQQEFEALSIDYASRFETSPPSWIAPEPARAGAPARAAAVPAVAFSGKLDGNIVKLLERILRQGESSPVLRLEFARVTDVDPIGCGLLLRILRKLQETRHELVLVGAAELAAKIRAILQVGRRDESEAPWLLLLEILRLLRKEKEFEEASIDYCVTFEVSPPAFHPPGTKVTTTSEESGNDAGSGTASAFAMPQVIEGRTEQLMATITAYALKHEPAVLDCSRLNRIDFSAAGQMIGCLAPLAANGKTIEFQGVNHLVAALFKVIGLHDIARVLPRKH